LPSKVSIAHIDIRTFAHATEDPDKVETALLNTIPNELVDTVALKKTNLTGHYGNPIILIETRIKERNTVQRILQKLSSDLSIMDKQLLADEITQHLERGNLYLRLDKQSAYMKKMRLYQTDPIHFKIHFKRPDTEEILQICRGFGLIP
jgi:RNA binding exosome subunit